MHILFSFDDCIVLSGPFGFGINAVIVFCVLLAVGEQSY